MSGALEIDSEHSRPGSTDDEHRFVTDVETRLEALFDDERRRWAARHPAMADAITSLESFVLQGGKRLRPRFAYWGHRAGGGAADRTLTDVAAALELFHAFALIHDDVMDGSDTRRHGPTVHRWYVEQHSANSWRGEPRRTSEGLAILLGDLAFAYSTALLSTAPTRVRKVFDEMRIELHVGQYLDLIHSATGTTDGTVIAHIAEFKSAKYSVERPLHLGAALAEAHHLTTTLSDFGLAVGQAFQYRDDLLGVFGHPSTTGKPSGDDLLTGKQTALLHLTRIDPAAADNEAVTLIGGPHFGERHLDDVRTFMIDRGIVAQVERMIDELVVSALSHLRNGGIPLDCHDGLEALARSAAWRAS